MKYIKLKIKTTPCDIIHIPPSGLFSVLSSSVVAVVTAISSVVVGTVVLILVEISFSLFNDVDDGDNVLGSSLSDDISITRKKHFNFAYINNRERNTKVLCEKKNLTGQNILESGPVDRIFKSGLGLPTRWALLGPGKSNTLLTKFYFAR